MALLEKECLVGKLISGEPSSYDRVIENIQGQIATIQEQIGASPGHVEKNRSSIQVQKDILRALDEFSIMRLLCRYHYAAGIMSPVVDIEEMKSYVCDLYASSFNARLGGFDENKGKVLVAILLISLSLEPHGQNGTILQRLEKYRSSHRDSLNETKACLWNLVLLILDALYHFYRHDELLAGRTMSLAARMSLELGLHRKERLLSAFPEPQQRSLAVRVFWSIYVLDRRWSIGTEMPFVIQDCNIDPLLPEPEPAFPYLRVMIAYSRIAGKVLDITHQKRENPSEAGYLNYQVQKWFSSIPPELKSTKITAETDGNLQEPPVSSILLALRRNQVRLLLILAVLKTTRESGREREALSIAQDTIQLVKNCSHDSEPDILHPFQQISFHLFLVTALETMLWCLMNDPITYKPLCHSSFNSALDLIKPGSSKLSATPRLWGMLDRVWEAAVERRIMSPDTSMSQRSPPSQTLKPALDGTQPVDRTARHSNHAGQAVELMRHIFEQLTTPNPFHSIVRDGFGLEWSDPFALPEWDIGPIEGLLGLDQVIGSLN